MPKASGSSMKIVRASPKPAPSRAIKHFDQPAPGGGAAKHADRIKASGKPESGAIDGIQQRY
jgi:hypothetical protein